MERRALYIIEVLLAEETSWSAREMDEALGSEEGATGGLGCGVWGGRTSATPRRVSSDLIEPFHERREDYRNSIADDSLSHRFGPPTYYVAFFSCNKTT